MKPEDLEKIKDVESVLQFGSSLNGKTRSDVDICIFLKKHISFKKKLAIISKLPSKYDVSFYDDLPAHIKKRVLSEGKIIFTKDYYKVLERIKIIDYEYPKYELFLEDYHNKKMASING